MDRRDRRDRGVLRRRAIDAGALPREEPAGRGGRRLEADAPDAVVVDVPEPERRLVGMAEALLRPAGVAEVVGYSSQSVATSVSIVPRPEPPGVAVRMPKKTSFRLTCPEEALTRRW